jgi:hypothetical protein
MNIEYGKRVWRNEAGKLHRADGSAIEFANGDKDWYIHGERHREDGPAIEWAYGSGAWYLHGQLHRNDGPGNLGQIHPAIHFANGYKEWWICENICTKTEFINLLVQHHLKIQLITQVLSAGVETLIKSYTM